MANNKRYNKVKRVRARQRAKVVSTAIIMIMLLMLSSYIDTRYTRDAVVGKTVEDGVEFYDTQGNTWVADVNNVVEGQTVVLKMYTNNTNNTIDDDVIIKVKPTAIEMIR